LELGGNAAALIDKNSNWEAAIPQLVASAFGFAGQVCIKTQRILVDEAIAARFEAAFLEAASALRVGNPSAEETRVGPVIDDVAGTRLQRWIGDARAAGANVHHDCVEGAPINRVEPAVVTGPASLLRDLDVSREEVFGPVAVIQQFSSWREGIAEVNRSRYGLQAGVFSDSLSHVHEAITELEVGGVVINDTPSLRLDGMPYGGVKDSGLGREGVRDAAREMTDSKVVLFRR
jgi:acyl-CoA reductase-like NAD-dependent aldehyde dehydrogenase